MLQAVNGPPLITVDHLTYRSAGFPLWRAVSFRIHSGGLIRLYGANGVGKSTLLRLLAGLLTPFDGLIALDGRKATAAIQRQAIAYLGHQTGLKADLTARENLELACALGGRRARQFPDHVLAIMNLRQQALTRTRYLSMGQQRRLALGRLWLSPASIWLIDEPYANLDREGRSIINRILAAHRREGGAAIITSHDCSDPLTGTVDDLALHPF